MFEVYECKDKKKSIARYVLTLQNDPNTKYLVTLDDKCKGYPKTAKRPYKGRVMLISNSKFIPIQPKDNDTNRKIYSAVMDRVCTHYQRQLDIQHCIDEDEAFQASLIEQQLDMID